MTGRYVPIGALLKSVEEVPIAVKHLAPLADFYCEFHNAPNSNIAINTNGVTWESFVMKWKQTCSRSQHSEEEQNE